VHHQPLAILWPFSISLHPVDAFHLRTFLTRDAIWPFQVWDAGAMVVLQTLNLTGPLTSWSVSETGAGRVVLYTGDKEGSVFKLDLGEAAPRRAFVLAAANKLG
jgi:hypothetical protein